MADPKTWVDVALAALPVVGTLAGAGVGAWFQGRQAKVNHDHARELAKDQQAAARQQAMGDRSEQHRQQLLAYVAELLDVVRAHMRAGNTVNALLRDHRRPGQTAADSWREVESQLVQVEPAVSSSLSKVLLLAKDPALHLAVEHFQDRWIEYRRALTAVRLLVGRDSGASPDPVLIAQRRLLEATKGLESVARELLGVRLAEPGPAPSTVHAGPSQLPPATASDELPTAPPGPPSNSE